MIIHELTKKIKLYKIKSIDSLSLSLISCQQIQRDSLKYLKQYLSKHLPNLKKLDLNLYRISTVSKRGIEEITEFVSSFKNLESLQIRFVTSNIGANKDLNFLIKRIRQSQRSLKNLCVDLSGTLHQNYDDLQLTKTDLIDRYFSTHSMGTFMTENILTDCALKVSLAIPNYFQTLKALSLNFCSSFTTTDEICLKLGKGILERMRSLKRLSLNFNDCKEITNQAMALFSNIPISKRRMGTLEYLTLEFAKLPNLSDVGLKMLSEGICLHFTDLKGLVVNLNENKNITDNGVIEFNTNITNKIKSLQSFTLATDKCKNLTPKSTMAISKDICLNLKELKGLCLLPGQIDNQTFAEISSDFENNLTQLEKLNLRIDLVKSTKFDISKFTHTLNTTFKDLQELKLDFDRDKNYYVNDETLTDLGNSLQGMMKLKRLALNFFRCQQIGRSEERIILARLVPKSAVLETFEVFFGEFLINSGISDEQVDALGASLYQYQRKLRKLSLKFAWCPDLTEGSFKRLCEGIRENMKDLQNLYLNVTVNININEEFKTQMKIALKEILLVVLS